MGMCNEAWAAHVHPHVNWIWIPPPPPQPNNNIPTAPMSCEVPVYKSKPIAYLTLIVKIKRISRDPELYPCNIFFYFNEDRKELTLPLDHSTTYCTL